MAIMTTEKAKGVLCHSCGKRVGVVRMHVGKPICLACDPHQDDMIRQVSGPEEPPKRTPVA